MKPLHALLSPAWPGIDSDSTSPVLLLLHGYGSNEHDLAGLVPMLPRGVEWASLRGPMDMGGGAAAWFPLGPDGRTDQTSIEAAAAALWEWVDAHIPSGAPVLPLGFSQGGLMALQMLRTRPERVAATVVLGGFLTAVDYPTDDALRASRPPVFWGRGTADTAIWPFMIERMSAWLPGHSTLTERVYADLGHAVNEVEMADVREFLAGL